MTFVATLDRHLASDLKILPLKLPEVLKSTINDTSGTRNDLVFSRFYLVWARKSFIALRDETFEGEDPQILEELRRRTNHDEMIKAFRPLKFKRVPVNYTEMATTTSVPNLQANRRYYSMTTDIWFPMDPVKRAARHKMIELIEQAIYGAQYRMKDLEPIAKKYLDLLEFRINFIFKRMETIESELEVIFSLLHGDCAHYTWTGSKMRVFLYIVYYENVLMKNVDVQYMCEMLFRMHAGEQARLHKLMSKKSTMKKQLGLPARNVSIRPAQAQEPQGTPSLSPEELKKIQEQFGG